MILDRLEYADMYRCQGAEIALALDYLRRTDFAQTADGRYDLDGDRVYAIVSRYRPKPLAEAFWEAHRKYADVQYVAEGAERIGYAPLGNGVTVRQAYDPRNDVVLYEAVGDFIAVTAGSFAIFTPYDVHAPGLAMAASEPAAEVQKVVVKCRLREQ